MQWAARLSRRRLVETAYIDADEQANRRRERRVRVVRSGRIVFNHGFCAVDCVVRNVSAGGAMIDVPSIVGIPERFSLITADQPSGRIGMIVWRVGNLAGIHYS